MSIPIRPLKDRIVIKQMEAEAVTVSGLVVPGMAEERPQKGTVMVMDPDRIDDKGVHIPMDVKEGDKVIYAKCGRAEVRCQGEKYIILPAQDLLAVVE